MRRTKTCIAYKNKIVIYPTRTKTYKYLGEQESYILQWQKSLNYLSTWTLNDSVVSSLLAGCHCISVYAVFLMAEIKQYIPVSYNDKKR